MFKPNNSEKILQCLREKMNRTVSRYLYLQQLYKVTLHQKYLWHHYVDKFYYGKHFGHMTRYADIGVLQNG